MLSKRKIEERKVRQDKILDGALRVFKIHGIEKTTMDEIANESGFGKATLYYYYGSKDEVFVAIMEQGWKNLWEAIENKIVEEKSPKNKFIGIVKYDTDTYNQTLELCHNTVGVAILNTSITIVFGFSILVLSNFIPTIYFGVFTGIAMLLAMLSVLTLLPKLILIIKPFGHE